MFSYSSRLLTERHPPRDDGRVILSEALRKAKEFTCFTLRSQVSLSMSPIPL